MDLFILRHAIAEEKETYTGPDSERPLTEKGAKKMRRIAGSLRKMEISFDVVLSSPFRRAKETAEIVVNEFHCETALKFSAHLKVGGNPAALIDEINKSYGRSESILLVGHEPYLSGLISMLISGENGLPIALRKGGICKLSVGSLRYGRCATLEWLMAPSQIIGNSDSKL